MSAAPMDGNVTQPNYQLTLTIQNCASIETKAYTARRGGAFSVQCQFDHSGFCVLSAADAHLHVKS